MFDGWILRARWSFFLQHIMELGAWVWAGAWCFRDLLGHQEWSVWKADSGRESHLGGYFVSLATQCSTKPDSHTWRREDVVRIEANEVNDRLLGSNTADVLTESAIKCFPPTLVNLVHTSSYQRPF